MVVEIRRGSARFTERVPGRLTRHAFSFGPHYDAERLAFGPMVCHDDHLLGPGEGFDTHRHQDLVIVTTVLDGALRHRGPDGEQVLHAGDLGVLRTGSEPVEHAEHATDDARCRFVQVWLRPDPAAEAGVPGYEVHRQTDALDLPEGRYAVRRAGAGETLALPALAHVFVASGALLRFSLAEPLAAGDALLLDDEPGHAVVTAVPTTLLEWVFTSR